MICSRVLRIVTLSLWIQSLVLCHLCKWISEGIVRQSYPHLHPQRNPKAPHSLQRHQMCVVMDSRREGPFARHQISPVPKAGPDRVSSASLWGGETQALCTRSSFCLHEPGPWIPPTRADRGRQETGRREALKQHYCLTCLSTCLFLCMCFYNPVTVLWDRGSEDAKSLTPVCLRFGNDHL